LILEIKAIKLDFGEIVYLDNNIKSDTAIVLLHGFGGDKDIWNRFSAELDGKKRIIILDIPGHGQCSGLIAPDTLIRDNYYQLLRCHNESETNIQAIY